jgi:hypothetical protein
MYPTLNRIFIQLLVRRGAGRIPLKTPMRFARIVATKEQRVKNACLDWLNKL